MEQIFTPLYYYRNDFAKRISFTIETQSNDSPPLVSLTTPELEYSAEYDQYVLDCAEAGISSVDYDEENTFRKEMFTDDQYRIIVARTLWNDDSFAYFSEEELVAVSSTPYYLKELAQKQFVDGLHLYNNESFPEGNLINQGGDKETLPSYESYVGSLQLTREDISLQPEPDRSWYISLSNPNPGTLSEDIIVVIYGNDSFDFVRNSEGELTLYQGFRYIFDQSDPSNVGKTLYFEGVINTVTGEAGVNGKTIIEVIPGVPSTLIYGYGNSEEFTPVGQAAVTSFAEIIDTFPYPPTDEQPQEEPNKNV